MKPSPQEQVASDVTGSLARDGALVTNSPRISKIDAGDPAVELRRRQIAEAWLARMRSGSLIELKRGDRRNLFMVHDGDGETLLYLSLSRRLPAGIAVFGLEPRHTAGIPLAHASIEEMAAFHLEAVRRKQPHGPYLLGGLCAGGIVAYEMAAQLVAAGETVGCVVMLEAAMPSAVKRPGIRFNLRFTRFKQAVADRRQNQAARLKRLGAVTLVGARKAVNALRWELTERCSQWWTAIRFRLLRAQLRQGRGWPRFIPPLSIRQIYMSAYERYVPKPLALPSIVLVRATSGEGDDTPYRRLYVDDAFGWRAFVPQLTVIDVEGGHSSILEERFVDSLAAALQHYLDDGGNGMTLPRLS